MPNTDIESLKQQEEQLRWMISQLLKSCDNTPVMLAYIKDRQKLYQETLEKIERKLR